jgi:hypothetical protein
MKSRKQKSRQRTYAHHPPPPYPDSNVPFVPPANIATSQELSSANSHSKINLLIHKPHKQTKKESGRGRKEVTTNTEPPTVATSPTLFAISFRGIRFTYHEYCTYCGYCGYCMYCTYCGYCGYCMYWTVHTAVTVCTVHIVHTAGTVCTVHTVDIVCTVHNVDTEYSVATVGNVHTVILWILCIL